MPLRRSETWFQRKDDVEEEATYLNPDALKVAVEEFVQCVDDYENFGTLKETATSRILTVYLAALPKGAEG